MKRRICDLFSEFSGWISYPPDFLCIFTYGPSRWAGVMVSPFLLHCCGGVATDTGSPERPPTPRGGATAPRLPRRRDCATPPVHSSPRCAAVQLGEPGAWKGALPGTGCLIPGMVGDNKKWKSQYDTATHYCVSTYSVTAVRTGCWVGRWMNGLVGISLGGPITLRNNIYPVLF